MYDLLFFQMTHGASLAPDPHLLHPPFAADIVRRLLLAAHLLGILVNLLLCKNQNDQIIPKVELLKLMQHYSIEIMTI